MHPFLFTASILPFLQAAAPGLDGPLWEGIPSDRPAAVFVDEPGDGNVWARGRSYKARFGADGVEFVPFLGSAAPRNFPIRFRLESVRIGASAVATVEPSVPTVAGTTVTYDRGAVVESWELGASAVEQRFRIDGRPEAGDLVVRLAVDTDLAFAGVDEGLFFEAPGLGGVRFGDAIAFDAKGDAVGRAAVFSGDAIEVRVPAAFVAAAEFPLTIDPVVSSVAIDTAGADQLNADVAYDETNDLWCVSFEEIFSAGDHDVVAQRRSASGAFVSEVYVDGTSNDSRNPAVANNQAGNQFLVVYEHDPSGLAGIDIRARTLSAAGVLGAAVDVTTDAGDEVHPDVGGDPSTVGTATNYLVVWADLPTGFGDTDIFARRVSTTLGLGPILTIDSASQGDFDPAVTKSCGEPGYWMVVWHKSFTLPPDDDIWKAVVTRGGAILAGTGAVDGASGPQDFKPDVAGDGDNFLVVWSRFFATPLPGDDDVMGARFTRSGTTFANVSGSLSLTALEPGGVLFYDQGDPRVDTDGCRFVYAYQERASVTATDHDVRAATLVPSGTSVAFHEGHVAVSATTDSEERVRIASRAGAGGGAAQYFVVWDRVEAPGDRDIRGALYEGSTGNGSVTTLPVGCGTPEPIFVGSVVPTLGLPFTFHWFPTPGSIAFTLVGAVPALPTAICPSQGGCSIGVNPIFLLLVGNDFSATVPCDPALIDGTVAFQGIGLNGAGGCAPPASALAFNATDVVHATVQ